MLDKHVLHVIPFYDVLEDAPLKPDRGLPLGWGPGWAGKGHEGTF